MRTSRPSILSTFFVDKEAENYPFEYPEELMDELRPFMAIDAKDASSDELIAFQETIKLPKKLTINEFMVTVNQAVSELVGYTIRMEPGVQSPHETILKRTGSCRDSAWLLINLMRRLGLQRAFARDI